MFPTRRELFVSIALILCGSSAFAAESATGACTSTRTFFARELWPKLVGTTCFRCHNPDGDAPKKGARLVLQPSTFPGFLEQNLATMRELAPVEFHGRSELLVKPLGGMDHGGGVILSAKDPRYAALKELVRRLKSPEICHDAPPPSVLANARELDASATFRKAALHLVGRLPTAEEEAKLAKASDTELREMLRALVREPGFSTRVEELWGDVLLTDKFRFRNRIPAIQMLAGGDWPEALALKQEWEHGRGSPEEKQYFNDAIAREPLDLIRWVVEHDRPFDEILTADYALVDDARARLYEVQDGASGLREAKLRNAHGIAIPHAGILSTPAFLNRWPTTPTNRSRGRARLLLKEFLATDILALAERPVDVATVTEKENPTMNAEQCAVCHRIVDPIAGGFRGWDEKDYEKFRPDAPWHDDMVHPGLGATELPSRDYGAALPWLARQIASDPRFDLSIVRTTIAGITGHTPMAYPADGPDFKAKLRAWEAEDGLVSTLVQRFRASGRNYRELVVDVVLSPTYRLISWKRATPESMSLDWGTARLLPPEVLDRKLRALTGVRWRKGGDFSKPPQDWLTDPNFSLMAGGIDGDTVTSHLAAPNGLYANLAWRMADELSCIAVANDLARSPESRLLLAASKLGTNAFRAESSPDEAEVREQIAHLIARLWGETVPVDGSEVDAAWALFRDTWQAGQLLKVGERHLPGNCVKSPEDGHALPDVVRRDESYEEHAWMAVVAYLLADVRVLYE